MFSDLLFILLHLLLQPLQTDSSACSDSVLSEMMPDIAMATASVNQITIQDSDLELDLGDGNSHMGTMYI